METLEDHLAVETPGAPVATPGRVVTGTRGLREVGFLHDVVSWDPCLPRETWVTRCGWRFGQADHVIYDHASSTCPKCAVCRRTGRGALDWEERKKRKGEVLEAEA